MISIREGSPSPHGISLSKAPNDSFLKSELYSTNSLSPLSAVNSPSFSEQRILLANHNGEADTHLW